jgi:hypothetical protein
MTTKLIALFSLMCFFAAHTQAGGSWLINGRRTEVVEVETSATDYNALYTDGSRTMQAQLVFDPSVSSQSTGLFKAYVPWDGEYEFFTFDPTYESIVLSPTISSLGFQAGNLIMYGSGNIRLANGSSYISFEERLLSGGGWMAMSVADDPWAIINRNYADSRYVQSSVQNEHISIYCYADDPQQDHKKITIRATAPGVGDVTATVDPEEGFVVDDQWGRAARISSSGMRLGTNNTEIEILGSEVWLYPDATSPAHALNRRTGDARYIQRSEGITTNHTFQAGDVLQIQNGIITAINP